MKLAAIYNVFDCVELLKGSMDSIKSDIDLFIIVYQDVSNFGEKYDPIADMDLTGFDKVYLFKYNPDLNQSGFFNEKAKRNLGIEAAKTFGCTHFLQMDCDEYYENFAMAKDEYSQLAYNGGSVCKMFTYFKNATLRFENEDNYYVPFIHKLNSNTFCGFKNYPFYVDPTRSVNEMNVREITSQRMHHYSWVRKDIERKIRNSSAKVNIERSQLLQDYNKDVKAGDYIVDFRQKLIEVPNIFNINI